MCLLFLINLKVMTKLKLVSLACIIFQLLTVSSCKKNSETSSSNHSRQFGIFTVLEDDKTIEMDGVINSKTLSNFNSLMTNYSEVNQINIVNCDGSSDDEINLQVSLLVYQNGMSTHIMDKGEIASGGVDFFLAGIKRSRGSSTQIGVHSWGGEDDNGNQVTATDFPVGHAYHLPYINYYTSIGFIQADAEAFYYFTINAASADDIHWMTDAEITQYMILKD